MPENDFKDTLLYFVTAHRHLKARVFKSEVKDQLRQRNREPVLPLEFHAQFGEDMLLWDLFHDQPDGFFIEVGAHDGVELSVSYVFEAIGWKGILIEPLPEQAKKCAESRPSSRVVQAALAAAGGSTANFTAVTGRISDQFSFLTSDDEHRRRIKVHGGVETQISVPVMTMNDVLADHTGPIDFASIDVEGGEIELLKGFDLNRFRPRVLLVEDNYPKTPSPIDTMLDQQGYTRTCRLAPTNFYARRDDADMLARCRLLKP